VSEGTSDKEILTTLDVAMSLHANGYVPVRIEYKEKMPRSGGWQVDVPTDEKISRAFLRPSNLGVRTGDLHPDGTCLVAIDVDIEEHALYSCVERAIGIKVPTKRGKKGATYFVRMDTEVKTQKIQWVRNGKKISAIDVLARGAQTVIPPSVHPDTNQPYQWIGQPPLHEVHYKTLPIFPSTLLDEIRGFCRNEEDPIFQLNSMQWMGAGGGGNTHDICLAAVSSMVARNWTDNNIQERVQRAKREACEAVSAPYNWPQAEKTIQEWIDSARDKKFDTVTKKRSEDVPAELLNRYAYVIELDRIIDKQKAILLNAATFNNLHARDMARPWVSVLSHPDLVIVDKLTYAPGQPKFCKERSFNTEAHLDCFNMYYAPDLDPEEGDVEPFTSLVRDFCDLDPDATNHVLSFLAHIVQFPGERINHALVLQGIQGVGKDSIALAMRAVLGAQNYAVVTLQNVESDFNEWAFGKQMIVFSEMLAAGRRSVYNKCKNYVTDDILTINTKHIALQRVPNRANYIFVTNYRHSLSIDPSDRRMWVWFSKMTPKEPSYYIRFYKWLADKRSAAALLHFLSTYDTRKFNPTAAPPMTDAKRSMIKMSSSEVEQMLREAHDTQTWPMQYDIISIPHVVSALRPLMRVSASMVAEALENIVGNVPHMEQRPDFGGGKRPRLRCIRNDATWAKATNNEVRDYYRIPLPPQSGETEGGYEKYTGNDSPDRGPSY
jgi:hypothetical protein